MINIPLPFLGMWAIMFAGVITNVLARINAINQKSPDDVLWWVVLQKFFKKEWASYGSSLIFTGITAFSFQYIKQFDNSSNAQISSYAKWIPLAVPAFYFFGVLNQLLFYRILGRIQSKTGKVDVDILKEDKG